MQFSILYEIFVRIVVLFVVTLSVVSVKSMAYFVHMADPQYGLIEWYNKLPQPHLMKEERGNFKKTLEKINLLEPKPDCVIIGGDIVNAGPHEEDRDVQVKAIKEDLKILRSDIPLYILSGNHDIDNIPTPKTVQQYMTEFSVEDYYSRKYNDKIEFLFLNSQYFQDSSQCKEAADTQKEWLKAKLKEIKEANKHAIIFQHIPPMMVHQDEEKNYFNYEKELRIEMLELFAAHNVIAVFCGHVHHNTQGVYTSQKEKVSLEVVCTTSLGLQLESPATGKIDTPGIRLVRILDDDGGRPKIQEKLFVIDDIPRVPSFE